MEDVERSIEDVENELNGDTLYLGGKTHKKRFRIDATGAVVVERFTGGSWRHVGRVLTDVDLEE